MLRPELHVLHLEDEESLRDIVKTTLQILDADLRVVQFEDSDDALDYIHAHGSSIDLFLLDVRVPGSTDGVGVAKKVVATGCLGLIAFLSAYASPDSGTLRGISHVWLAKPVDLIRMRSLLKRARREQATRAEEEAAKPQLVAVAAETPRSEPVPEPALAQPLSPANTLPASTTEASSAPESTTLTETDSDAEKPVAMPTMPASVTEMTAAPAEKSALSETVAVKIAEPVLADKPALEPAAESPLQSSSSST
jgi:CheY-like chemotaxis protein